MNLGFQSLHHNNRGDIVNIQHKTLAVDTPFIDITNIPATFKHLKLIASLRSTRPPADISDVLGVRFNGDIGANYSSLHFYIFHSSTIATSQTISGTYASAAGVTAGGSPVGAFAGIEALIPDYLSTTKQKSINIMASVFSANSSGNPKFLQGFGQWLTIKEPVNRITLGLWNTGYSFALGSSYTLYGMK